MYSVERPPEEVRQQVFQSSDNRCQWYDLDGRRCTYTNDRYGNLHLHHRFYPQDRPVMPKELTVVCSRHHFVVQEIYWRSKGMREDIIKERTEWNLQDRLKYIRSKGWYAPRFERDVRETLAEYYAMLEQCHLAAQRFDTNPSDLDEIRDYLHMLSWENYTQYIASSVYDEEGPEVSQRIAKRIDELNRLGAGAKKAKSGLDAVLDIAAERILRRRQLQ